MTFGRIPVSVLLLLCALVLPLIQIVSPGEIHIAEQLAPVFIFAIMGLGLNVVTGFSGLLHLGVAAFMAIGAFTYAILTCSIYPFQLGFWSAIGASIVTSTCAGYALGLPTLRLRGDYLAIVTLGFGEIVQDCLRNLESITKGSQGINPLPGPRFFGTQLTAETPIAWYYLLLLLLTAAYLFCRNLYRGRVGFTWRAIRDDELAARCMGISILRTRSSAFATGAALCGLAGALWASFLGSSGEPGNYDFQVSVITLCIVIIGGIGSLAGVLVGSIIMVGFNSILLGYLSRAFATAGLSSSTNVFTQPNNWKYLAFGLTLILMMRYRSQGLIPESASEEGCEEPGKP